MFVDLSQLEHWVAVVLWPLFRIAGMFMAMPIIGTQLVPMRIRLGLALAVTMVVVPVLPPLPEVQVFSFGAWLECGKQIFIGAMIGFMLQIMMESFAVGGQLIASQMGLGFASMTDPANGTSVVVLGQFYLMMVMMMFLAMDGHLVMIDILVRSFEVIPVATGSFDMTDLWRVVLAGGWLFSAGLLMALPAVTALLVVNFAFGIMTKAAPQLNIFAIGFPFTMLMGIFIAWAGLEGFLGQYQTISHQVLSLITDVVLEAGNG